ncbi:hypothetical protein [Nostoc sp.]|uniref:hypothetical protein n=1 Tax=Nostoc sp. TaxID=1180 RepID=UPI003593364D
MFTFTSEQNSPCGTRQVSIGNGISVISCFDIKIDIDKLIRSRIRMAIAPRITHLPLSLRLIITSW